MRLLIVTTALWAAYYYDPLNALLVAVNQPCNKDRDILLLEDPQGNGEAFLRCNGVGVGTIGFWEKNLCPNNMVFDFVNQQCRADTRRRKSDYQPFTIAILNNSCARGERCIGGTFCDGETRKCLCPPGLVPELESLSCVQPGNSFKTYTQVPNQYGQAQIASATVFQPNPIVPTIDRQHQQQQQQQQQQHNHYVQQSRSSVIAPVPLPAAASPGSSCANGEKCGGGSVCTYPMKICLCPGELEDYGGECVMPKYGTGRTVTKVGIGAACGPLAECDFDSSCVNGKCQCVSPLMEHDGRCFLRRPVKEVGPGELCDNGQVCSRGSVCDAIIPVCVCPPEWDLSGDSCVRGFKKYGQMQPPEQSIGSIQPSSSASMGHRVGITNQVIQPQPITPVEQQTPVPSYNQYTNTPMATVQPDIGNRNNYLQYGGSKQAGVGENCSVNTDCMIGAYCKGNTVPATCQCLSTHVNVNGRCEKVIYPGQTGCQYDIQCTTAFTGTKCIDRECICPVGYKAVEQTCVSGIRYPGNACNNTSEVTICSARSVCINSVCRCVTPLMTNYRMRCIKKTYFHTAVKNTVSHEKCASELDCGGKEFCLNGICRKGKSTNSSVLSTNDTIKLSVMKTRLNHGSDKFNYYMTENRRQKRKFSIGSMDCWPDQYFCANGTGICLDEKCHCMDGYRRVDNRCEKDYLSINSHCDTETSSMECEPGTKCVENKCVCTRTDGCADNRRLNTVKPDETEQQEFCLSDEDCGIGLSCISSFCRCSEGYIRQGRGCSRIIGSFKSIESQCNDGDHCIGGSKCINSICSCTNGSLNSGGKCHQKPSGSCANGEVCIGGARCELAVCRCPPGTHYTNDECASQVASPGESCDMHKKCATRSLCRFGRCMCYAGYQLFKNSCVLIQSTSNDITAPVEEESSAKTVVISVKKKICNSTNKQSAVVGECCDDTVTCLGNSVCIRNTCECPKSTKDIDGECKPNYTPEKVDVTHSSNRLEQKIPGAMCRLSMECPYRTDCIRGLCRCKRGDTIINNVCRKAVNSVLPGNRCSFQEGLDCTGESHCINGKCICKMGLKHDGSECISELYGENALPGQSCGEGQMCSKGSLCIDNFCKCRDVETINEAGECVLAAATEQRLSYMIPKGLSKNWKKEQESYGDVNHYMTADQMFINIFNGNLSRFFPDGKALTTIKKQEKCANRCEGTKYCTANLCICLEDNNGNEVGCIISDDNDKTFLEKMQQMEKLANNLSNITLPPYISSDIIKNNNISAVTANSVLPSTMENLVNVFILPGYPGGVCRYDGTCINNAICEDGKCKCDRRFININGICRLAMVSVGDNCTIDEQCVANATCAQGLCQCRESYVQKSDICISMQDFLRMCNNFDDCTVEPVCNNDNCHCPIGFTNTNERCSYSPGNECYANTHCSNNRICDNGYCVCASGYQEVNDDCVELSSSVDNILPVFPRTDFDKQSNNADSEYEDSNGENDNNVNNLESFNNLETASDDNDNVYSPDSPEQNWPENSLDYDAPLLIQPYRAFHPVGLNRNYYSFPVPGFVSPIGGTPLVQDNNFMPQVPYNQLQSLLPFSVVPYHILAHGSTIVNKTTLGKSHKSLSDLIDNSDSVSKPTENPNNDDCKGSLFEGKCMKETDFLAAGKQVTRVGSETGVREQRRPLESCSGNAYCTGAAYCTYYSDLEPVCICPLVTVLLNEKCIALSKVQHFSKIGEKCRDRDECSNGAICLDNKCVCPSGYRHVEHYCFKTALPKQQCNLQTVCSKGSVCDMLTRRCVCDSGTVPFGNRCIVKATVNRNILHSQPLYCETRDSCPKNSFCSLEKLCKCFSGFRRIKDHCIPNALIRYPGERCSDANTCTRNSRCLNGLCSCINRRLPIFFSCDANPANIHPLWHSSVFRLLVKRDTENYFTSNIPTTTKFSSKLFKLYCKNGLCSSLLCHQSTNHTDIQLCRNIFSRLENLSVPVNRGLDNAQKSLCAKDIDCIGDQFCQNGFCTCERGKIFVGIFNICLPTTESADTVELCLGLFQHCRQKFHCVNKTHCSFDVGNSIRFTGNEQLSVPPGGSCYNAEQCSGGSICRDGWCICPEPTMIVNRGICIKPVNRQSQSTTAIYSTSEPFYPRTEASSYKPVEAYTTQTLPPPTSISANGMYATTKSTKNNIIVRKAIPGTNCGPLDECVGGSMCIEGTCICPPGYVASQTTARCEPKEATTAKPSESVETWMTTKSTTIDSFVTPKRTTFYPETTTPSPQTTMLTRVTNQNRYVEYNRITSPSSSTVPMDECAAVGLYCRGGTVCINMSCQCPTGFILHNDQCVPSSFASKRRGKSWSQGQRFAKPNEPCRSGETCTGGSYCTDKKVEHTFDIFNNRKTCICPPMKPLVKKGLCVEREPVIQVREAGPGEQCDSSTRCTDKSVCYQGMCRCEFGHIAISGKCVELPAATSTSRTVTTVSVAPGEHCNENRVCRGGSNCVDSVCRCTDDQIIVNGNCVVPVSTRLNTEQIRQTHSPSTIGNHPSSDSNSYPSTIKTVYASTPQHFNKNPGGNECNADTDCNDNRMCIVGSCRCKSGFIEREGKCIHIDEIDYSDHQFLVAPSTVSPQRRSSSVLQRTTTERPKQQQKQTLRPRVTGPPLKRPRPSGGNGKKPTENNSKATLRTRNGDGTCPPGNEPARDEATGKVIVCNGIEPNCPPRSYCYVTGYASEDYNCCKSW